MSHPSLPPEFLDASIAHRALHDVAQGRPENAPEAVEAACVAGYGIEIDLQLSADGVAMVFHDYDLKRLTGQSGPIRQRSAAELAETPLIGGATGVPTLAQVLDQVAGRVPLLIELKDQDGAMGPAIGPLEEATARALKGYAGPAAVMSFNPHSIARMATLAPDLPRGLTTCAYRAVDWPLLPAAMRDRLAGIPDLDRVGAGFVSHDARDLDMPRIVALRDAGMPVLCWTIRSATAEAAARRRADNVTFEGYPSVSHA
ncbi:glycerophosphodiester phosphodiesterase family protein [Pseudooceanicola aestuarii]|uniref:glycerophosphodiester phosphodiesterase family protein n=1 Tax=Pseudooceanicola aestuarii TaxID=2697319 RepID=UPI0013D7F7C0|nr:glycerophosphodiester phosphodiesterase family protein [Pseudooceanicola aestuarii]